MAYDETAHNMNVAGFLELIGNMSIPVQAFTASGTPRATVGTGVITLNHTTDTIAITIPAPRDSGQLLIISDISASGTAEHVVTFKGASLTPGGYTEARFDAPAEQLILMSVSKTSWLILLNSGSVALS